MKSSRFLCSNRPDGPFECQRSDSREVSSSTFSRSIVSIRCLNVKGLIVIPVDQLFLFLAEIEVSQEEGSGWVEF